MSKQTMDPLSFERCRELCSGGGTVQVSPNTYLQPNGGESYFLTLDGNVILEVVKDGTYLLDSCGYRTATTKDRLNAYGPVRVWQKKGVWWVGEKNDWTRQPWIGARLFYDGMVVGGDPVERAMEDDAYWGDKVADQALADYRQDKEVFTRR